MRTHTLEMNTISSRKEIREFHPARRLKKVMCLSANLFLALVPAFAFITGAVWLVTEPQLVVYLQVALWGAGFVFLGMAIDAARPFNLLYALTGLSLPVLAMVSSRVAAETAILAVVVLAVWTSVAIWKRVSVESAQLQ